MKNGKTGTFCQPDQRDPQYLDTRPHGESRRLIDGIQAEAQQAAQALQPVPAPAETQPE